MTRRRTATALAVLGLLAAGVLCARSASATSSGSGYLPFPTGYPANVTQGNFGSFSHNNVYNYYAWDFVAATGSIAGVPVWSATNGTVAYARNTVSGQVDDFNSCFAA